MGLIFLVEFATNPPAMALQGWMGWPNHALEGDVGRTFWKDLATGCGCRRKTPHGASVDRRKGRAGEVLFTRNRW